MQVYIDDDQGHHEYDVVSVGRLDDGTYVVTYVLDADLRQCATIETGSRFFSGLKD